MATRPDTPATGDTFQQSYEILGELGHGSFARVYEARQLSTGRNVALKVLVSPFDAGKPEAELSRRRFRREMRVLASLSHPHIVRLLDSGDADGRLFAAFELLPGATLRAVLETEGRLEFNEALGLMAQVLDALVCAHERGIVHRDLKPENIMISKTGARRNATVLDFGLAGMTREAANAEASRLTATQEMMGTPAYSAPEQLRGESASSRSDLYSWGLITLECLIGEAAIGGRTAYEALSQQLSAESVPIPVWLRDQPVGRLLSTVTTKDVERRDVGGAALLESLDAIRRDQIALGVGSPERLAEGEQRQITVLACGIDVTGLHDAPLELEDLDRAERSVLEWIERIAGEEGGTLARPQPGRQVAIFGYPHAHEDDARRAARTAMRIVDEACGNTDAEIHLDVRVGIHSGLGLVRMEPPDVLGPRAQVVGAPLRIASRLEQKGGAGEVLVTEETRLLLRDAYDADRVRKINVPEHPGDSLHVFGIARRPAGRLALRVRRETPFAGRAAELGRLGELWQRAKAGEPAVVVVEGEAGIGKSRLLRELTRSVSGRQWIECRCVPEGAASPLRPIVEMLNSLSEPIEELLEKHGFDRESALPLFASLLGRAPTARGPLKLSPDRQKELTLRAVVSLLVRMSNSEPRVLTVEDLHWADPTTLELLNLLVEECRSAQAAGAVSPLHLLVAFTARPEFKVPWSPSEVERVSLGRLSVGEVKRMMDAGPDQLPPLAADLVERVTERTDGVPLFVEEVVQVLVSSGGRLRAADEMPIPVTLRELLATRLDGLSSSAYETAQVAAAFGREFRYAFLEVVADKVGKPDWVLRQDLRELLDAGLLYQRASAESYVFKHALVRDAAYESMMRSRRQRVHRSIADTFLEITSATSHGTPEVIAHHLFESGDASTAAEYWNRAGDRALRHAAYEEAIVHLERGLAAVGTLEPCEERDCREFELLISLGTVHFSSKGYAAPEVDETFERARRLYEGLGEKVSPLKLFTGLFAMYVTRGDRAAAEGLLPRFAELADRQDDPVTSLTGVVALSVDAFWRGDHERARVQLERGRRLYQTDAFRDFAQDYGFDGGIFVYGYSVWNSCIAGRHDEAETIYRELSEIAEASFDPYSPSLALAFGMAAAHTRRDPDETLARARRLIEIADEQRMYLWLAIGQCGAGWALTLNGCSEEGLGLLRQGLELNRLTGAMTTYGYYLTYLAEAEFEIGAFKECREAVDEALELCGYAVARAHEPALMRVAGELYRKEGNEPEAESWLRRALATAEARGAGAWAVRAGVGLARLLRENGDLSAARAVLDSISRDFPRAMTERDRVEAEGIVSP